MQLRFSHLSLALLQLILLLAEGIKAFQSLSHSSFNKHDHIIVTSIGMAETTSNLMELELETEPDGGKELSALKTMPGCRMKEMEAIKGDGFEFWMTAQAEGSLVKEIRTQILKDAAKKANFPGFRKVRRYPHRCWSILTLGLNLKGQVPPYAQPQITEFAVQESLIKTVQAGIGAFGLEALPGSDGKMEVHEDVAQISKMYKTGMSIPFTATVCCKYTTEAVEKQEEGETAVRESEETS